MHTMGYYMNGYGAVKQPEPIDGDDLVVQQVMKDLMERAEFGKAKYGKPLQANNGRDALVDAYQEALDLCCYIKQELLERARRAGK
jgi:hypothetical protein